MIKIANVCERKLGCDNSIILSDEHLDKSFFIVMELLRPVGDQMRVSTSIPFSIEIDVS